jgi:hypothetical protein
VLSLLYAVRRQHGRRPAQRGFALLELAIAAAVTSMVVIWAASRLVEQVEDAAAQTTGVWLLEIKHAMDGMLALHFDSLAGGVAPQDATGRLLYVDAWAPTLAELKARGHLPLAFPEFSTLKLGAGIRIVRGLDCPGDGCRLDAVVYTLAPLVVRGSAAPDAMRIAAVTMATAGYGGSVTAAAPNRLRGSAFDFANPLPGGPPLAAGTVAVWSGLDGAAQARFVRMRDARNPDFQGSLSVAAAVSSGGRLTSGEHLWLKGKATPGALCEQVGLFGSDHNGALLSCLSGAWVNEGGFGGAYALNNQYGCHHYSGISTANPRTGGCSCPSGFTAVLVSAGGKWTETEGWTEGFICVR